jgi:hypothetical protein
MGNKVHVGSLAFETTCQNLQESFGRATASESAAVITDGRTGGR